MKPLAELSVLISLGAFVTACSAERWSERPATPGPMVSGTPGELQAASGSGFYYVEVTSELVAYLTVDAKDPELLWVLGFGPPP